MVSYLRQVSMGAAAIQVLILVVMEDGLVLMKISVKGGGNLTVLILVVMEDGLVLDLIRLY